MFNKILIANRGEIACRIAHTAHKMGIRTVAVYSHADRNALHLKACDEAVYIGGSAPSESYLLADKIIQLALYTGSQAIHPGFGFLSENADFAEACAKNELSFIGPGAAAIRSMGSKSAARQNMQKAGVPVLPGYDGDQQDAAYLQQQAQDIGYPLLIKAVAGGGGKGLRAVDHENDFMAALDSVKRESLGAFGDDTVLLERYLPVTRHIEIQLFADTQGNVVHLFDRDCSMQRRHQKVIEEAPAPDIATAIRQQMADAAIACAKAVDYVGAGTVEFLLAPDGGFYFMEMNTRLQVEHPVSEMITGQDLVSWQLMVASGEALPLQQSAIKQNGHAIEARIYAENPEQNFLPSIGHLDYLSPPASSKFVRIDTGVTQGDEISAYYDPMIAKLICHGKDREQALLRLAGALHNFDIIGPKANVRFLSRLCQHPKVVEGGYDTRFIEHHLDSLLDHSQSVSSTALIAASLYSIRQKSKNTATRESANDDPHSPWASTDNWRIGETASFELDFQPDTPQSPAEHVSVYGALLPAWAEDNADTSTLSIDISGQTYAVNLLPSKGAELTLSINGRRHKLVVVESKRRLTVLTDGKTSTFTLIEADSPKQANEQNKGSILSPMPGKVIACPVKPGQTVQRGETMMVVEAMKMEHAITAPQDGVIEAIHFTEGDQVADGDRLLSLQENK